jgi:hypothetical protein
MFMVDVYHVSTNSTVLDFTLEIADNKRRLFTYFYWKLHYRVIRQLHLTNWNDTSSGLCNVELVNEEKHEQTDD